MSGYSYSRCVGATNREYASAKLLQQRLDLFVELRFVCQTDKTFLDLAITRDHDGGRKSQQSSEFCGYIVITQNNRIIHGHRMAIHIELRCLNVRRNYAFPFVVHCHAQNGETLIRILLLETDHPGNFDAARFAPGGPKVYDYHLALQAG